MDERLLSAAGRPVATGRLSELRAAQQLLDDGEIETAWKEELLYWKEEVARLEAEVLELRRAAPSKAPRGERKALALALARWRRTPRPHAPRWLRSPVRSGSWRSWKVSRCGLFTSLQRCLEAKCEAEAEEVRWRQVLGATGG